MKIELKLRKQAKKHFFSSLVYSNLLSYLEPLRFVTNTVPASTEETTEGEEVGVNLARIETFPLWEGRQLQVAVIDVDETVETFIQFEIFLLLA